MARVFKILSSLEFQRNKAIQVWLKKSKELTTKVYIFPLFSLILAGWLAQNKKRIPKVKMQSSWIFPLELNTLINYRRQRRSRIRQGLMGSHQPGPGWGMRLLFVKMTLMTIRHLSSSASRTQAWTRIRHNPPPGLHIKS